MIDTAIDLTMSRVTLPPTDSILFNVLCQMDGFRMASK